MKSKVYPEYNKAKYSVELPPQLLVLASQKGGVLIATTTGMFKMEKVEVPDGYEASEIIVDEAVNLVNQGEER